ncbi:hypothetical protein [Paracoccus sp. IB05]|uniref:hypothetical protein n=1 Tax=Paracoccus sp. IB05 TaxID=2779367 RepID=UPI0018E79818|nr:hypothetical protein [Paracoccus sp. IB05]MBJ2150461.1 hypothetical protein [Paracoccus sp. IB05]
MIRFLLAFTLLLAPVARPALAGNTAPAAALATAQGEDLLQAAYATCLSLGGAGNQATEAFRAAGWDVETDDEAGFSEIAGPEEIYALTWSDGGYCLVQSETIGSDRAAALLSGVIAAAGQTAVEETGEDGCLSFDLQNDGLRAEVTSSGNDPVCTSADSSGVSFMWAQTD